MTDACHSLCGCCQKLSKLTNQRAYQELVYQNRSTIKESLTGPPSAPFPAPRPVVFFFSLAPIFCSPLLSESLEQATACSCIFSSPPPALFLTRRPLPWNNFFGSPQASVSFIIQNGGRALEGLFIARQTKYACSAG